ncbi:hypothetical protein ACJQWK_04982 [Exserohilum turcicum]
MSMEYAGGISTMVLALIAMGIIAALLGLMILTAIIIDLPNRKRRKESPGIMETIDLEKGFETEAVHKSIIEVRITAPSSAPYTCPSQSVQPSQTQLPQNLSGSSSTLAP